MKNFDYLKEIDNLKELYFFCNNAEETQQSNPNTCALNCRMGFEWLVKAIYKLKHIEVSDTDSLYELMTGEPFVEFLSEEDLMKAAHYIRKVGNMSAHQGDVKSGQAFFSLLNLYNVVGSSLLKLRVLNSLAPFDRTLIPSSPTETIITYHQPPQPSQQFLNSVDEHNVVSPASSTLPIDYSEYETRKYFIDLMLQEAGWDVLTTKGAILSSKACIEIPIEGMPNNEGVGYADYVLYGANGKPLAVVEAKKTTKDPIVGRHQAELYADGLEKKHGIRPVIYYTNGFKTYIIDGLGYPPREVYGFHTEADLNVLIQRRNRNDITDLKVKEDITGREYQKRAIKSICEHFNGKHRKGLLVMATGTGKTRVAISLSELLMRNGWVKNVLFLADRTALVRQAAKNFVQLLPSATTCILSEDKTPDMSARIIFSTYQTMINYIDADSKKFSVGRFDLIIIDEAHRSVFGKYTAILSYFDCLMVGLTATPREQVDRSTYDLFEMEGGCPNFAYELEEAVADGYLVPYNVLTRTTSILKQGIKYDDLTDDEKEQLEKVWKYEKAQIDLDEEARDYHRDITNREIFKYIFNEDTIDKVLIDLMKNGQKVNSGETIGKTIIFAYNHKHADLIVKRFNVLYPDYGSNYCVLIDNYINYAQDLIETFEVRNKLPQIAVSVDMLDTGIDVPDILNLVFFKPIHSKIKFWQMIGRGTRLSANIFDVGKDKKEFYIFDWCGNFEFFDKSPNGREPLPVLSLTERLFSLRCDLAFTLQHAKYQADEKAKALHDETKNILRNQVIGLNDAHIYVRLAWEYVDKFRKEDSWTYLSTLDVQDLKDNIARLLIKGTEDDSAKKFDVLLTLIQLSLIDPDIEAEGSKVKVIQVAQALQERASIPQVAAKMPLINDVANPMFWEKATLSELEFVRKELRELVKFLLGTENRTFTIDIEDVVEEGETRTGSSPVLTYKQRVIDYLAKNRDLPVIQKIINMVALNAEDIEELERICWQELGTKEEYHQYVTKGEMICGDSVGAFIRAQVGVDRKIAIERFSQFISNASLNSTQEEYLKTIISYVCENGDIVPDILINNSPFCEFDWEKIFGGQVMGIRSYVENLHSVICA